MDRGAISGIASLIGLIGGVWVGLWRRETSCPGSPTTHRPGLLPDHYALASSSSSSKSSMASVMGSPAAYATPLRQQG
ncbi:trypsin-like serine protease [Cutibacterium acnes JCM 18918]|nr:trypsin-like serine protease [Cutibacterium acnes JCM 18918]